MKNLLLSMTILAIFLSVNNITFAQDYDSTEYLQNLKEAERQEKQLLKERKKFDRYSRSQKPNKFKTFVNYVKEEGEKSRQQYIQTYHQQQVQNTRYNSSNYSSGNTRRDLADIVNRRSGSHY